jgi:hypothetical protein
MDLTDEQKTAFARDGYVKLPGIVPGEMVRRARRAINGYIGEKGLPPDEMSRYSAQSFCPGLGDDPIITDLYNGTPLRGIAESLIGPGMITPVRNGQIALRFPWADREAQPKVMGPHIDGMYSPNNGVTKGTISSFTALVGIFLSDLPDPFAGNFAVWPGTHLQHAEYFQEAGPESLLKGMPPIILPEPVQFLGQAGDAALVHYLLAHSIANNLSPNIRYAIFFRLTRVGLADHKWESMTDAWRDWPGISGRADGA